MAVMATLEGTAPAVGLTRSFDEPDAFASALLGGQFNLLPVRGEPSRRRFECCGSETWWYSRRPPRRISRAAALSPISRY
jgi:hypothetical protein